MRILAIDPGYERLGLAVLEKTTRGETLIYSDCVQTSAALPFPERLELIAQEVERVLEEYAPAACALERLYFNTNQKTAMMVAEVRGALMHLARARGVEVKEYTPSQVKIAITGHGGSNKKQVTQMVGRLITIEKPINYDDEYDAIAVGLTCLASSGAT